MLITKSIHSSRSPCDFKDKRLFPVILKIYTYNIYVLYIHTHI